MTCSSCYAWNSVAMTLTPVLLQEDGVFRTICTCKTSLTQSVGLWPTDSSMYTFVANCKLLINLFWYLSYSEKALATLCFWWRPWNKGIQRFDYFYLLWFLLPFSFSSDKGVGNCTVGESDYLRMVDCFLILYLLCSLTRRCFIIYFHCWDLVLGSHSLLCACMSTTNSFGEPTNHGTEHIFRHSESIKARTVAIPLVWAVPGQFWNCECSCSMSSHLFPAPWVVDWGIHCPR